MQKNEVDKNIYLERGSLFDIKTLVPEKLHPRSERLKGDGDNAYHHITVRMREIKAELRLTTAQLVKELNSFERVQLASMSQASKTQSTKISVQNAIARDTWRPMTKAVMASYLQGWVVQEGFMSFVLSRLENLRAYKIANDPPVARGDIRSIMDGWYAKQGIDPKDTSISPTRLLGKAIAPFYKRPIQAGVSGTFNVGLIHDHLQEFTITRPEGESFSFWLNPQEPVLVRDGAKVNSGDVIQYSVLMRSQKVGAEMMITHEPSVNHTTFYRWYKDNKMPRSIKTIELIDAAVEEASKATTTSPNH